MNHNKSNRSSVQLERCRLKDLLQGKQLFEFIIFPGEWKAAERKCKCI